MDQTTEEVTPAQPAKDRSAPRFHKRRWHRRRVGQAAVRTVPIVVLDIGPQDADKLLAADDEQLVDQSTEDVAATQPVEVRRTPCFGTRRWHRRRVGQAACGRRWLCAPG
jgi:hypothetical protein